MDNQLKYQSGLGNHWMSEAIPGALPVEQNSPKEVPLGLYAEQLSGSAFSAPRSENLKAWLYRIRPAVVHGSFQKFEQPLLQSGPFDPRFTTPNQLRWNPFAEPVKPTDFIESLTTICGNGQPQDRIGSAVHLFAANRSMANRYFYNADGEFMVVPQQGALRIKTEMGDLHVIPTEFAVIPKGIRFQVELPDGRAKGYVCENYGLPLRLPHLGVIGANGLANPRHFLIPVARYENKTGSFELIAKFQGQLFSANLDRSPLDVVAWSGNYAPYKYDLKRYNTLGSISYDHPDPSIFTVLTSPSDQPGTANMDFVVFPHRLLVAEHTFRPPYFHRNCMSEYMGLIKGEYDGKATGFMPGGGSLHNCMSGHGPDAPTYEKGIRAAEAPHAVRETLAFMFESSLVYRVTELAAKSTHLQKDYQDCWKGLQAHFQERG